MGTGTISTGCFRLGLFALVIFGLVDGVAGAGNRDAFFQPGKIRVLVLSGRNNHDWRNSTPRLKEILVQSGRFDVRVNEEPSGLTPVTLEPYDLLVMDYQGPRLGALTEQAILDFVAQGKGMVVVHGASYSFSGLDVLGDGHVQTGVREDPWVEFLPLVGGIWSESAPKTAHGRRHTFQVKFTDPRHPIARGLEAGFPATDELYHDLKMHPSARVLATTFSARETGGTGEVEPVIWTVEYGKGRVLQSTLGHDKVAMAEPGFVVSFARGCEWTATGNVSLAAVPGTWRPVTGLPRVLVVTGGHEFDADFYSLFDGDWLSWRHAPSNREAFVRDLRDRFDVLLLYDMSQELNEAGRSNLRAFAESGKGIVVVHHAVADYQDWEWWWKEVVGGKYVLEAGQLPQSTYQHDVEMHVKSVADHPITRDLGPFHMVDESYKGMWISPEVQILMETDAPTSDPPVVWVSPYEKSKVVYVQLGHDRQAHRYPGYRELIRRTILWTAGK